MASKSTGKSNSTGRWVERAATTGGGRTYRGQMPVNWYASLAIICIVGLLLIGFSRYQRTHQTASSSGPPTTSQQWFAALGIDLCGTMQPNLPASTNASKVGFTANGNGVLTIQPKNSSESGSNATLGKFVSEYQGLELSSSTLQYPGKSAYNNGDVCPKGTPDAGKPGVVIVDSWPSFTAKTGTETSGPPRTCCSRTASSSPWPSFRPRPRYPSRQPRSSRPSSPAATGGSTTSYHHAEPRSRHLHDRTHHLDDGSIGRNHQVRAVVLVGGEGTRLRPLTLTTPKQMLPIVEQPMIERVIGHLGEHGIDDAVLSLGYRPDAFLNAYPGGDIAGVHLTYAVEPTPLDTAGAIRFAADHAGIDDTFVVVNGDVLTDSDLSALIEFHRSSGAEGTISLTPVDDPSAFGVVPTDELGRVDAFIEKPPRDEAPTNFINAGTYVFEPSVLDRIPTDRRVSVERETFPALVEEASLYALGSDAYWLDTGTPDTYLRAHRDLLSGRRPGLPAPGAVLDLRWAPRCGASGRWMRGARPRAGPCSGQGPRWRPVPWSRSPSSEPVPLSRMGLR